MGDWIDEYLQKRYQNDSLTKSDDDNASAGSGSGCLQGKTSARGDVWQGECGDVSAEGRLIFKSRFQRLLIKKPTS